LDSILRIFTCHLFTILYNQTPQAAQTWTKNKGIDVFKYKMVLIPVILNDHWSLCVIINPGSIVNAISEVSLENPTLLPFILHLDPLPGQHNTFLFAGKVREWLNHEWVSMGYADSGEPFIPASCPVYDLMGKCYRP
jgi:Ulp1 family protease